MRRYLLGIFLFSIAGSGIELFLLEHTDGFWQIIPIALMIVAAISILWNYFSDSRTSLRVLQIIMFLFILSGLIGIGLHYKGNVEFELEMYPSMAGFELFWKTMKGATPVLAPGTMMALGLLGLVYSIKDSKLKSLKLKKQTFNHE